MMMVAEQNIHWQLQDLLSGMVESSDEQNVTISGLSLDSRTVKSGDLFFALAGTQQHGAEYIPAAVKAGAAAILYEAGYELQLPKLDVPLISIAELTQMVGKIAHRFYGEPSKHLKVIGITGTNGKTSSSWFMAQALQCQSDPVGLIGTLGVGLFGALEPTANTTPNAVEVHKLLAEYQSQNSEFVVMEVSSHALHQYRVSGVEFQSVVFLNISRDHLDYHGTMQEYINTKRRLFTEYLSQNQIFNIDDEVGKNFAELNSHSFTISANTESAPSKRSISISDIDQSQNYLAFTINSPWGVGKIETQLIGKFNLYNLMSVIAVLGINKISIDEIIERISALTSPPGRMQIIQQESSPKIIIDYAHTPDALEKVLQSLHTIQDGRIILVFGCGGDRDAGKRSIMGEVASCYCDQIYLTNDNPRSENPIGIIEDIQQGIVSDVEVVIELDRSEAIGQAIKNAKPKDLVLIAGKGHENYQIIGDQKLTFSDQTWVERYLGVSS